jgi:hypothetical protein
MTKTVTARRLQIPIPKKITVLLRQVHIYDLKKNQFQTYASKDINIPKYCVQESHP